MQTISVRQGYTKRWTVTLRYGRGHSSQGQPVTGVYSGGEALSLSLTNANREAVSLSTSSVAWLAATSGTVTLAIDNADTSAISPGYYTLAIGVTGGDSEPVEAFRCELKIEA